MSTTSADVWDEQYRSGGYHDRWERAQAAPELVGAVASLSLPRHAPVLDIGCGAGSDAIFLAECGYQVIGVDFSPEALKLAKQKADAANSVVNWRHGSALDLPVESSSIAFAADRGCFHHIQRTDRARYADEIFRVLQPGGCLLLRGAREDFDIFIATSADEIERHFATNRFSRGMILPFTDGNLASNVVLLKKLGD